jgi:hypothetical protein
MINTILDNIINDLKILYKTPPVVYYDNDDMLIDMYDIIVSKLILNKENYYEKLKLYRSHTTHLLAACSDVIHSDELYFIMKGFNFKNIVFIKEMCNANLNVLSKENNNINIILAS